MDPLVPIPLGWCRTSAVLVVLLGVSLIAPGCEPSGSRQSPRAILLATTTSVQDSGLLDVLLPEFTRRSEVRVRVIAVGTGVALRMGREGNADILWTHAPAAEQALVDEGVARRRTPIMENYFVIAGPREDPARVSTASSPEEAVRRIAEAGASWISRADESGTHMRERTLFRSAGLDPDEAWEGVVRTGSGMGPSLQVAGERRAYVLADAGTFLAYEARIGLVALSKQAPALRNVYSILQLDSSRFTHRIDTEGAEGLERFLISDEGQRRIADFGQERYGRSLFQPLHLDVAHPDEVDPSGIDEGAP